MVCYARPAGRMAAIILLIFLVFSRPVSHYFDTAALVVAITVAIAVAAALAAVAFGVFLAVRRRRAAAGGCVSCQLRCQHAMTEQPRRLLMVSTVDRGAARAPAAVRNQATARLPARAVDHGASGPRWPDRPAYRTGPLVPQRAPRPPARGTERERADSAV
ncbi:MAG: hypothetical protein ACRDOB_22435 [Streptosporangiaceae bacterium]